MKEDMTIDDIKNLVSADESRTLELKKTTGELKDGMHSACAFLNTEGGWLIFGIAPKSLKIIGQEVTDKTQQEIADYLGTSAQHYGKYESGKAEIPLERAVLLAKYYNVSTDYLLSLTNERKPYPKIK